MAKKSYSEKLRDPRWQKKRLEVLNRDEFTCRHCHSKEKTLHVHHLVYSKGEPWEIETDKLLTICQDCHEEFEARQIYQIDRLNHNFKLKLQDGFIRQCAVEIFQETDRKLLHDIIYVLWEVAVICKRPDIADKVLTETMQNIDDIILKEITRTNGENTNNQALVLQK